VTDQTTSESAPAPPDPESGEFTWAQTAGGSGGVTPPPPGGGAYRPNPPVGQSQASGLSLAGFWVRFLGYLVDGILLGAVNLILSALLRTTTTSTVGGVTVTTTTGSVALVEVIDLIVGVAYFTWFWSSRGATLGQMLVGIRVVDADTGGPLKPSQALIRYIGYILSAIPIFIGFIWAAFDSRKQGWMDKLASTQVVKG